MILSKMEERETRTNNICLFRQVVRPRNFQVVALVFAKLKFDRNGKIAPSAIRALRALRALRKFAKAKLVTISVPFIRLCPTDYSRDANVHRRGMINRMYKKLIS